MRRKPRVSTHSLLVLRTYKATEPRKFSLSDAMILIAGTALCLAAGSPLFGLLADAAGGGRDRDGSIVWGSSVGDRDRPPRPDHLPHLNPALKSKGSMTLLRVFGRACLHGRVGSGIGP